MKLKNPFTTAHGHDPELLRNPAYVANGFTEMFKGLMGVFGKGAEYLSFGHSDKVEAFTHKAQDKVQQAASWVGSKTAGAYKNKSHVRDEGVKSVPARLVKKASAAAGSTMEKAGGWMQKNRAGGLILIAALVGAYYAVNRWLGRKGKKDEAAETREAASANAMRAEAAMNRARANDIYQTLEAENTNYLYPEGVGDNYHRDKYKVPAANERVLESQRF